MLVLGGLHPLGAGIDSDERAADTRTEEGSQMSVVADALLHPCPPCRAAIASLPGLREPLWLSGVFRVTFVVFIERLCNYCRKFRD